MPALDVIDRIAPTLPPQAPVVMLQNCIDDNHRIHRARVHHPSYPVQRAEVLEIDETLIWAAGIRRSSGHPLRHYASEVNVKVYPLEKV